MVTKSSKKASAPNKYLVPILIIVALLVGFGSGVLYMHYRDRSTTSSSTTSSGKKPGPPLICSCPMIPAGSTSKEIKSICSC
ncbi:MAG TPA: hypothetical protein VGS28_02515 [Candidatus Saccharimonadales bacterium]|nr:hypothetical protein [Candidatus Saccharimonadales bacterium]